MLDEIDGLLLTGGGDIDPVLYGDERHPTVDDAEPGRDEFEIDLARRAMGADLPLLAICRGAQVLNVAAGGTLVQDIPSTVESVLSHSIVEPKSAEAHPVHVTPGSRLEQALGVSVDASHTCRVNSRHHQSVDRIGSGLVALGHRARRRDRSHRKADRGVLRRRAVASRELLADGRVRTAFRHFRQRRAGTTRRTEGCGRSFLVRGFLVRRSTFVVLGSWFGFGFGVPGSARLGVRGSGCGSTSCGDLNHERERRTWNDEPLTRR